MLRQLDTTPFLDAIAALSPDMVDRDIWSAIIDQAARFADNVIDPLDARLDGEGARLADGRVRCARGHDAAWRQFTADGWLTLALPEAAGGQGLPLLLLTACEELFNRASAAVTMLATSNRAAAALLQDSAEEGVSA